MTPAPRWTTEQLLDSAQKSRTLFRDERLIEPLVRWKETFEIHKTQFERLFADYGLEKPAGMTSTQLAALFQEKLGDALRYITGPPISADDLKVLAEASLAPNILSVAPEQADRIIAIIQKAVDPCRFPWISEGRIPTESEKSAAILASAALITAQRVSTDRRTEGKETQERAVKEFLIQCGFTEAPTKSIKTLMDAPAEGAFCRETLVGSRKADLSVRLFDGRLMPLECKVSNSSTNSVKRINNDAQVKASIWHREFGTNQVVPAAVLSGVFKVINLEQAQTGGLALFWAHDLNALHEFIESTRPST